MGAIQLREYQLQAIAELRTALAAPASSAVLVLPTGAGKTTVAAELTRLMVSRGKRVWFVAHLYELVAQARARMEAFGLTVGEIASDAHYWGNRPVQCCMVQTLSRRIASIPAHELPDFIFFDEGHHTAAGTYQKVLDACPTARRIGLTATPYRLDGKALGEWYQSMVEPITIGQLMEAGHLVPAHYALAEVDLDGLGERGGDYAADQAFKKFNKRQLYAGTVTQYENYAPGEKAICFCINVEHSLATVQAFNERGIAAAHLDGATPLAQRKRVLEEFAAGKWQVLSNVALFTEGFDLPNISCVILNRPTKSKALYLQMGGRGLRPSPGKSRCLIIDMGGNVKAHSFLDTPAEHSLESTKKKKGTSVGVRPMKDCKFCGLFWPISAKACEGCGADFPIEVARPQEVTFTVVTDTRQFLPPSVAKRRGGPKAVPADLEGKNMHDWSDADWRRACALSGYNPGWRKHQGAWQRGAGLREGLYQPEPQQQVA
ncbi:DEAD/DEAH box helicase [Hymenobacter setariae]|uniref:DEAD/DEAH box helicase n=1 Tax=Hymenobacter setariae TaxID=2594794 RepID=A0A558C366_9BACT|nr:DEAD/DEAH box helicase [Hymenobacter setariae]TVT43102.1 DEAD/DEAH box helicase [Hymenobacter setariae]